MIPENSFVPISFGPAECRLVGLYHTPRTSSDTTRPAILLCNPFGQEAIRAHRFLRTLAERLARAGHAVLRFDYFGTGDSMGDDIDFGLTSACRDLLTAHDELRRRSNSTKLIWVGMRLGATIALKSAQAAPNDLSRMIVWDPVIDGAAYLTFLRARHIDSLENEYGLMLKPAPRELAQDPDQFRDEAIGFALAPQFRRELMALRPESLAYPYSHIKIDILTDPMNAEGQHLEKILTQSLNQIQTFSVKHDTDWTSDTASNTSLVPTAALLTIAQQAGVPT